MRKKIKLLLIIMTLITTGCSNIKIIEKAPEKPKPVESAGPDIVSTDNTDNFKVEDNKNKETPKPTITPSSTPKQTSNTNTLNENLGNGQIKRDGIIFNIKSKEVYLKETSKLFSNAKLSGNSTTTLEKNSKLLLSGVSEDESVAMVKAPSGTIYYINNALLSDIKIEEVVKESTPTPNSESTINNPTNNNQTSNQNQNQNQNSESQPIVHNTPNPITPEPTPVYEYYEETSNQPSGGIPYPANPSSTSMNLGITVADEYFTATVTNDVMAASGPGEPLWSNGYIDGAVQLRAGETVSATGISENGYVRVEINGETKFINNLYLRR